MIDPARNTSGSSRLQQALERELRSDEAVQWHGWQLARVEWKALAIYVFAVPWTAFALMWTALATTGVSQMGDSGAGWLGWAFPLFGLPFIAVGLGMLSMPFVPLLQRGRVLYVVTGQRVMKLSLGRELSISSVPAERIGLMHRSERADGSGTLRLAVKIGRDSDGDARTEFFEIGAVTDVISAQTAVERMAADASTAASAPHGSPAPLAPSS